MLNTSANFKRRPTLLAICLSITLVMTAPVAAQDAYLEYDLSWINLELDLAGPAPIPLASDPGNLLGDSVEGYGFVDSRFSLTLSSNRTVNPGPISNGKALATLGAGGAGDLLAVNPGELDGELFFVDSFFDVFVDLTVTDVDARPGRDFAGQPDGASITLQDNGPARIESLYSAVFDKDAPNFGLLPPPEAEPYVGFFNIEIPLGGDINGNGENDKIKFAIGMLSLGDENRTFIELPDGTVINEFDVSGMMQGAIVDESTDPPFLIGAMLNGLPDPNGFMGGGSYTSSLLNPSVIPVPAAFWLFGSALLGLVGFGRRRKTAGQ